MNIKKKKIKIECEVNQTMNNFKWGFDGHVEKLFLFSNFGSTRPVCEIQLLICHWTIVSFYLEMLIPGMCINVQKMSIIYQILTLIETIVKNLANTNILINVLYFNSVFLFFIYIFLSKTNQMYKYTKACIICCIPCN